MGAIRRNAREAIIDLTRWPSFRRWPKFGLEEGHQARQFFVEHGWVILRDVFTADEVAAFRQQAERVSGHPGDILSAPGVERFILDPRVIQTARMLLGDRPSYFGDSTVSWNVPMMGFHKDNADRDDPSAPDWQGDYTLLRMGLYLQDHDGRSGGLALRDGSHTTTDLVKGRPLAAPTSLGDLVVWSLKTTHSGNAVVTRWGAFVPVPVVRLLSKLAPWLLRLLTRPMAVKDRGALFATFGRADTVMDRYLAYLKTRRYAVQSWQHSTYAADAAERANAAGLTLLTMRDQVASVNPESLNERYVALA